MMGNSEMFEPRSQVAKVSVSMVAHCMGGTPSRVAGVAGNSMLLRLCLELVGGVGVELVGGSSVGGR